MLVIRRKPGESIVIGDDIEIKILEIGPSRAKIGIIAPAHVPVARRESLATREQNLASAKPVDSSALAAILERLNRQRKPSR